MPNEVEETVRVINSDIDFHKLKLKKLDETGHFIDNYDIPEEHKQNILECIGFKMDFHNYKITQLSTARHEIMLKYDMDVEE